jgi:8-oxo-dGTP diphosphatase
MRGELHIAERGASPANRGGWCRRGVKALIRTDESVLLVKERRVDGSVFWTLPGGGLQAAESAHAGLRRELSEELDCEIVVHDWTGRICYAHHSRDGVVSTYDIYDCCVASSIDADRAEGILEARWVESEAVPARTIPQVRCLIERSATLQA